MTNVKKLLTNVKLESIFESIKPTCIKFEAKRRFRSSQEAPASTLVLFRTESGRGAQASAIPPSIDKIGEILDMTEEKIPRR